MGAGQVLVEIQPQELKFAFELKKQSSCSIQLENKSKDYVAFKVKTTSPKRYCVRPNIGILLPRSTCDFTVTMQAPKEAPPDMQLKDKFLVQSTVVPYGTTDEDIVPSFFSKENGRYIQENKLRVVLEPVQEITISKDTSIPNEQALSGVAEITPSHVGKDIDDLKLKLNNIEVKLNEAEKTIMNLRKENSAAVQESEKLQQEIALLRKKSATRIQAGFPFLFVVFLALVGMTLGYLLHS